MPGWRSSPGSTGSRAAPAWPTWVFSIVLNRARTRASREGRLVGLPALLEGTEPGGRAVDVMEFRPDGHWREVPRLWDEIKPGTDRRRPAVVGPRDGGDRTPAGRPARGHHPAGHRRPGRGGGLRTARHQRREPAGPAASCPWSDPPGDRRADRPAARGRGTGTNPRGDATGCHDPRSAGSLGKVGLAQSAACARVAGSLHIFVDCSAALSCGQPGPRNGVI